MSSDRFADADVRATYRFLAHAGRGVTELRVITPARGVIGIGYFDQEDSLVDACARANGTGNIYIGIQPRPPALLGKARNRLKRLKAGARDDDIGWLTTIVIDIDPVRPKDSAATEEELARAIECADRIVEWFAAKGFERPVRNMSGNGCQLWFAIPPLEIVEANRAEVRERLKAFEAKIRDRFATDEVAIDSIYNFSRLIKVIGTLSVKGEDTLERPHRISRCLDVFERREDAKLLDAILTMPLGGTPASPPADEKPPPVIAPALSPWLQALLSSKTRLRALFEGRGKTAIGPDGKQLDASSSGYDFSLALRLALLGVTDPSELATALWHRPDGGARAKGERYIQRTVEQALSAVSTIIPKQQDTETDDASRPEIQVNNRQTIDVVRDAWVALRAANEPPVFFTRLGFLVRLRLVRGIPTIEAVNEAIAQGQLMRVARWTRIYEDGKSNVAPPRDIARDMLVNPDPSLPELEAVVLTPVFDGDGRLLADPGYHPSAYLWHHKPQDIAIGAIPAHPSAEDARQARALLLDELLVDFPFVTDADRAHAVAALLLPFARRLIPGCTPLHLIEAPTYGSGKGLLGEVLSRFALTGKEPSIVAMGEHEDEIRKSITAALKAGPPVIQLDNVVSLRSPNLAKVLTTRSWSDRNLGESRMIELPNNALWIATGNNPDISKEIARRCIRIRIDTKTDRPWLRAPSAFKHHPLIEFVEQHRGRLIRAALVLIQTWIAAGRPPGVRLLGSFESWARVIGGILDHVGIPGFLENLNEFYENADADGQEWREFVTLWWSTFGGHSMRVRDLTRLCITNELMTAILGEGTERSQQIRLGNALREARDRIFEQYRIESTRDGHSKRPLYRLRELSPPATQPHQAQQAV